MAAVLFAQQRPDSQILSELQKRIGPSTGVSISVPNGVVTLSGTTTSLARKMSIVNMARRTIGVQNVVDRITVAPAVKRSDSQIANDVRQALSSNLSADDRKAIDVSVQDSVITLAGTLPSSYPKQLAGVLAGNVAGAVDVKNNIVVKPSEPVTDAQILTEVTLRFSQNPIIPASQIAVTVNGGVVTLSGTVSAFVQADQAESVARFAPGVVDVRNLLFVKG